MPLDADDSRISEPELRREDAREDGHGLTPARQAALDTLERELNALLKATGR